MMVTDGPGVWIVLDLEIRIFIAGVNSSPALSKLSYNLFYSLILCLTYTALVSGAEWRVVGTYILSTSLKTKVNSENAPITPRNHDGATVR